MVETLFAIGITMLASGIMGACNAKDNEIKWNNGICPRCGKKWHWRYFYRQGGVRAVALDCRYCGNHAELD